MRSFSFVLFLTLSIAACGTASLQHTQQTADALAREVIAALERRDERRLRELAISEQEFEHYVWPSLPAARPERNMPWSYVWMDLQQKSNGRLKRALHEQGGRGYELQSVRFAGGTTPHDTYRVHRDTVLVVRESSGSVAELHIVGSMLEGENGWKVFSYNVDQ